MPAAAVMRIDCTACPPSTHELTECQLGGTEGGGGFASAIPARLPPFPEITANSCADYFSLCLFLLLTGVAPAKKSPKLVRLLFVCLVFLPPPPPPPPQMLSCMISYFGLLFILRLVCPRLAEGHFLSFHHFSFHLSSVFRTAQLAPVSAVLFLRRAMLCGRGWNPRRPPAPPLLGLRSGMRAFDAAPRSGLPALG